MLDPSRPLVAGLNDSKKMTERNGMRCSKK
ncbi:MAG: hypothetical protein ACLR5S_04870 [Ruminococcus sp.]